MKRHPVAAILAAGALATSLAACGGGTGGGGTAAGDGASGAAGGSEACSAPIVNADAPQVSVWAWYPNARTIAEMYNEANDDVQVCLTNAGQGPDQYARFSTAIAAGTGAPDVIMLEAEVINQYVIQDALVDLTEYGVDEVTGNFSEGAIRDVSSGDAVYAVPVDGGPMALMYRTDIFEEYDLAVPTTWEEFRAEAEKLRAAGGPYMGDLGSNVPASIAALMAQNGAELFEYNAGEDPAAIGITLDSPEAKEVMDYWAGLVADDLVGTQDQFNTEYITGVIGGDYATYTSAAWAPGYLTGAGAGEGEDAGTWAVAELPQWDPENPRYVNWGGSTFAVTSQSEQPELAARVAKEFYQSEEMLRDGVETNTIFPLNTTAFEADWFIEAESSFFSGQKANQEIYIPAANAYEGFTYSPFTTNFYAEFTQEIAAINAGEKTGSEALDDLDATMEAYAESQGFTLIEQ